MTYINHATKQAENQTKSASRTNPTEDIKDVFDDKCRERGIEPPSQDSFLKRNSEDIFNWKNSAGKFWGKIYENSDGSRVCICGQYTNGAGLLFKDCIAANGKNFKQLTPEKKQKFEQEVERAKEESKKHQQKKYEQKAKAAQNVLKCSREPVPDDFKYAVEHGLKGTAFNLFPFAGFNSQHENIVIPLFDKNGKHWANQFIAPEKNTLAGGGKTDKKIYGKMVGNFNIVGDIKKAEIVYLAEGAATVLIIYLATGKPCVFCVNSGNIEPVYNSLREKYPDKKFILAADNDIKSEQEGKGNAGKNKAQHLKAKYNLPYVLCPVNSDFCDYYRGVS